jgi:hypothetical protein
MKHTWNTLVYLPDLPVHVKVQPRSDYNSGTSVVLLACAEQLS